jgi:8-oxo-dGTP pyrophosphatase MutT (NUDIX family)
MEVMVRAAGGVAWRGRDGDVRLLLVHRPKYDDWSFPKGKCKIDESDEDCAVREIEEETNLRVTLGPELVSTTYISNGQAKHVRYWLVEPTNPDAALAQNEVDELGWLTPDEALERLTYERDQEVLRSALGRIR